MLATEIGTVTEFLHLADNFTVTVAEPAFSPTL